MSSQTQEATVSESIEALPNNQILTSFSKFWVCLSEPEGNSQDISSDTAAVSKRPRIKTEYYGNPLMGETNTGIAGYLRWLFQQRDIAVVALESRQCRQILCNIPGPHLHHSFVEKAQSQEKQRHCCALIFVGPLRLF